MTRANLSGLLRRPADPRDALIATLTVQRDEARSECRAQRHRLLTWLYGRADAAELDGQCHPDGSVDRKLHQRLAGELRDAARDVERMSVPRAVEGET